MAGKQVTGIREVNPYVEHISWIQRTNKEDAALLNLVTNLSRKPGQPFSYLGVSPAAGGTEAHTNKARRGRALAGVDDMADVQTRSAGSERSGGTRHTRATGASAAPRAAAAERRPTPDLGAGLPFAVGRDVRPDDGRSVATGCAAQDPAEKS